MRTHLAQALLGRLTLPAGRDHEQVVAALEDCAALGDQGPALADDHRHRRPGRQPELADLLQIAISPASRMHGVEVGELRLPVGSSVSMVIRQGRTMVPERRTVLKSGDELLVVTPRRQREATEERLRQVSAHGRLARWLTDGSA